MSRSRKKAIIKDNPKHKELFRRRIRRTQNQEIQETKKLVDTDELQITPDKTIVNDYDYCDYKMDYHFDTGSVKRIRHWGLLPTDNTEFINKIKRK